MIRLITCIAAAILTANAAWADTTLVAFGDSTTALRKGVTVYAQLLQAELPGEGGQYKVINAGVGGNTTSMAAIHNIRISPLSSASTTRHHSACLLAGRNRGQSEAQSGTPAPRRIPVAVR